MTSGTQGKEQKQLQNRLSYNSVQYFTSYTKTLPSRITKIEHLFYIQHKYTEGEPLMSIRSFLATLFECRRGFMLSDTAPCALAVQVCYAFHETRRQANSFICQSALWQSSRTRSTGDATHTLVSSQYGILIPDRGSLEVILELTVGITETHIHKCSIRHHPTMMA